MLARSARRIPIGDACRAAEQGIRFFVGGVQGPTAMLKVQRGRDEINLPPCAGPGA